MKILDTFMHSKLWKAMVLLACIGKISAAAALFTAAISAIQRGDEDWWTKLPETWNRIA